jgi:hypothetical protein
MLREPFVEVGLPNSYDFCRDPNKRKAFARSIASDRARFDAANVGRRALVSEESAVGVWWLYGSVIHL